MKYLPQFLVFPLIGILFLSNGCTSNPFMDDEKIEARKITGRVLLSDDMIPNNVYVWLENLCVGTFTNVNGNYTLALPPPELQDGGLGFSGECFLYFYIANYKLKHIPIVLAEGDIASDQEIISKNGAVRVEINLEKLIDIDTKFYNENYVLADTLMLSKNSHKNHLARIKVATYSEIVPLERIMMTGATSQPAWPTGLVLEPTNKPIDSTRFFDYDLSWPYVDSIKAHQAVSYNISFNIGQISLPDGEYQVFPHFVIHQRNIPYLLLENLGNHFSVFGADYHLLPMKRKDGILVVLPES